MTENEAIKKIKRRITLDRFDGKAFDDLGMAIQALDKKIPKKTVLVTRGIIKFYPCPCCSTSEKYIQVYPRQKYCVHCGQKLDWND